jgi:hypothetical protein
MANPTDPCAQPFRVELDDGQIVEADDSTVADPVSGSSVPAVLLRMSRTRAHMLAHLLDDWCRVARVFAALRSSEVTERALAWTLEASAAAAGDPEATRCALHVPDTPTATQRLAAVEVLRERERRMTPVQRIAVVDAAARWLAEDAGEDLAEALLQAVCSDTATANFVYLALIEQPETAH